ncbi:kinase-like domain-containing protein [Mycena sanguinolenta]|nr:kinase-like domain-containing protein [Mycena sanguinolenta]
MLGDSPELPHELVINPTKLEDTSSSSRSGGSSDVQFGYYKFHQRREPVAIKEFRFSKPYGELKPRFSVEAFTWAHLSKGNNPFIVKFFGADICKDYLRLISRWQTHANIVHFLNLEANNNENFRCQKMEFQGSQISEFLASFTVHDTIDEVEPEPEAATGIAGTCSTSNVMKPWDPKSLPFNSDSISTTETGTRTRLVGSINWTAPERFRESPEPTKASDVYAFAYLDLEIFRNEVPFYEENDRNAMEQTHINYSKMASAVTRPQDLEDLLLELLIPQHLWDILVGCMQFDSSSRPTATAVHTGMKKICEGFS